MSAISLAVYARPVSSSLKTAWIYLAFFMGELPLPCVGAQLVTDKPTVSLFAVPKAVGQDLRAVYAAEPRIFTADWA